MTTDEIIAQVYNEWGETSSNSIASPAVLTSFANRGQRHICREGNILLTCATLDLVSGQETYTLAPDYLKADACFLRIVNQTELFPMSVNQRNPAEKTGTPTHYYIWGANSSGANVPVVGLSDIPDYSQASGLKLYYRQAPRKMVHSSEGAMVNCELIESWQDALVEYCLMKVYQRLGKDYMSYFALAKAGWDQTVAAAQRYVNPMQLDYPIQRTDTAGYSDQTDYLR